MWSLVTEVERLQPSLTGVERMSTPVGGMSLCYDIPLAGLLVEWKDCVESCDDCGSWAEHLGNKYERGRERGMTR